MFEIYLNGKGALLVVPNGMPIPNSETGRWRRKKKSYVAAVSDGTGTIGASLASRLPPYTSVAVRSEM